MERIKKVADFINNQNIIGKEFMKATYMVAMFAPRRPYDLKNNENYMTGDKFGNFFFGAAAAVMGYTEMEGLKAGAAVQQFQNFVEPGNPVQYSVDALISAVVVAATTGQGDAPGDGVAISSGFKYKEQVYDKDSARNSVGDSCTRDNKQPSPQGAGGAGGGGGWNSGGSFSYIGSSCIGNCGGTMTVTVTDPIKISSPP